MNIKHTLKYIRWVLPGLLALGIVVSCQSNKELIDGYCGGIVYAKDKFINGDLRINIRNGDEINEVNVYRIDWNNFKIGDTIKCNHNNKLNSK